MELQEREVKHTTQQEFLHDILTHVTKALVFNISVGKKEGFC